jgi:hypothetical protein
MSEQSVIEAYKRKLASNPDGQMTFDTVEITDPNFSRRYLLVVGTSPLTAALETGETVTFEGVPMEVGEGGNNNDTDQQASFTLPDVGNLLDDEMSRLPHTNRFLGDVSHADISSPVIRTVLSDIDQTD